MAGDSVRTLLECSLLVWDRENETSPKLAKSWQPRWCSVTKHSNRSNSRIRIFLSRSGPGNPIDTQRHEVPMENYAGLEVFNAPFEGKPHCFSIMTYYCTYCFAVASVDVMKAWVDCIVSEIGFEWKFEVRVLATQNIVPAGDATMRFYPRFFSLTSGAPSGAMHASPPVCLGLWQHNHLRRYGGSQGFSFESGSRSIGGPEVYRLATHQGTTIKELFDCVAHGKPLPEPQFSISGSLTSTETDSEQWVASPSSARPHVPAGQFAFNNDTISLYSTTDEPAVPGARAKGRDGEYDYVAVDIPRRPNPAVERDVNYLSIQVVSGAPVASQGTEPSSPTSVAATPAEPSTIYSGVDLQKTAQLRDALVQSHRTTR